MRLRTYRVDFPTGTDLPKRILVAKWGNNPSVGGDYRVTETTARELPLNLKRVNFDTVDIDFEHNTVPGSPAYRAEKEPRNRAGFGSLSVVPGEGVYLDIGDNWTPQGEQAVRGKQFQDISPTILTNAQGEIVFIHSVALTRHGATEDLFLDTHSAAGPLREFFRLHSASLPAKMDTYKQLLLTLLKLDATATDSAIHSAALALAERLDALPAAADLKTMCADFKALKDRLENGDRDRAIADAVAAGKLVPKSLHALPLATLKPILDELPAGVVPMDRRTPAALQIHSASVVGAASLDAEVRAQLGLSEESWKKYGG